MITLILQLAAVGFIVWVLTTKVPMNETFKIIIYVIVAFALIIYLMDVFGIADIPIPRL